MTEKSSTDLNNDSDFVLLPRKAANNKTPD